MLIGFYLNELNYRGVANSTFKYAYYNEKILKNRSVILYNKKNHRNINDVKKVFSESFITIGVNHFREIQQINKKFNFDYVYTQKGGEKDDWTLPNIKILVHCIYPQKLSEIHGYRYAYISNWLEKEFSNKKVKNVPYIVELKQTKNNLKKKLKISKGKKVFGCHGGSSSFDIQFVKDTIIKIVKKRKDIIFLFLNIDKFVSHSQVIFLKGTFDEVRKKEFLNTCDAMIYGRSLGESFGLACAEFSALNKLIISYKFNRHRSHILNSNKNYVEYNSSSKLYKILNNYKKTKNKKKFNNIKKIYSPKVVMSQFKKVFLQSKPAKISFFDKLFNYKNLMKMNLLYLQHKLYSHYYNFFIKDK